MEVEKATDFGEFRKFASSYSTTFSFLTNGREESQHFYYVRDADDERVGFVELRYAYGSEEASIGELILDQLHSGGEERADIFAQLCQRAQRLGARRLSATVDGKPDWLLEHGWTVRESRHRVTKSL